MKEIYMIIIIAIFQIILGYIIYTIVRDQLVEEEATNDNKNSMD